MRDVSRTRWAAIGAAVAVAIGGGGVLVARAADTPSVASSYVGITPCRVVDTRPGSDNVGARSTPIGAGETYSTAFAGAVGKCNIPPDAVAVVLNLAVINPTVNSYLTVFPAGGSVPLAANVNFVAGQPPVSNAATVRLGTGGQVSFYNLTGKVDVSADVSGYYVAAPTPKRTQTITVEGSTLQLLGAATMGTANGCASSVTGNFTGRLPLSLPVGATITGWGLEVYDGSSAAAWSVTMYGAGSGTLAGAQIFNTLSGGASSGYVTAAATPSGAPMVAADRSYYFEVNLGATTFANGLCRVTVTYVEP